MDLFDIAVASKLAGGGGGGGGSSYTLLHQEDIEVSTTSTTATKVKDIEIDGVWTNQSMIYVRIRDKAGKRNGYFWGSDSFFSISAPSGSMGGVSITYAWNNDAAAEQYGTASDRSGIVATQIAYTTSVVSIYVKYSSFYSRTIDGTYSVEVYALDWPDGVSPFN